MQLREVKDYYDNGKLWTHYFVDEIRRKQGKFIVYYGNGIISREVNLKDDNYHGKRISYNKNSTVNYIEYYWYGKKVTKAEYLKFKYDEVMKCS